MSAIKQAAPCQLKIIKRMFDLRSKDKFRLSNGYYKNTATEQLRAEARLSASVLPNASDHGPLHAPPDCVINNASSRVCERGTKCCTVYHSDLPNAKPSPDGTMTIDENQNPPSAGPVHGLVGRILCLIGIHSWDRKILKDHSLLCCRCCGHWSAPKNVVQKNIICGGDDCAGNI